MHLLSFFWSGSHKKYTIRAFFLLYDIATIFLSFYLALYIGYACEFQAIPAVSYESFWFSIRLYLPWCILIYWSFRLYNSIWRLVGYPELFAFSVAVVLAVLGYYLAGILLDWSLPRRYYIIGGWLQLWTLLICRFSYRFLVYLVMSFKKYMTKNIVRRRALMIGAGTAGQIILRDVHSNDDAGIDILCIVDDDPSKHHCLMGGVPIVGGRDDIMFNVRKYQIEEILFAIPTATASNKRDILAICQETGCKIRILPGICSLVNGEVSLAKMREVTIEELLGRESIRTSMEEVFHNLVDKVILVTGGGGFDRKRIMPPDRSAYSQKADYL